MEKDHGFSTRKFKSEIADHEKYMYNLCTGI